MAKSAAKQARKGPIRPVVSVADALFSRTQQRVFGLLFGQADRTFGTVELIDLAGSGRGAVQRELERLVASGLVVTTELGLQKRFQANRASPIFLELQTIVQKTGGAPQVLRGALQALAGRASFALLYGSTAKGMDRATSDIDVLVVSDSLTLEELFAALQPAEAQLGRPINPTLYTPSEFRARRQARHPFLSRVLNGEHVVLLGSEDAVAATR